MAGSIKGDMKNDVRKARPGRLPRPSASAQAPPMVMESNSTQAATHSDSQSAFMNSLRVKNFSNQRRLTPTGGKEMYGVGLSAKISTIAIGSSRNASSAKLSAR